MGRSRKQRSSMGEAWGRGGRGVMSGGMRLDGVGLGGARLGVAGSVRRRGVGRHGVRSCSVGQAAWGRSGGGGQMRTGLVGWARRGQLDYWVQVMDSCTSLLSITQTSQSVTDRARGVADRSAHTRLMTHAPACPAQTPDLHVDRCLTPH
jgi:hypothetical protein